MKQSVTIFLLFISLFCFAQKKDQFSLNLSGGVKRTLFKNDTRSFFLYNISPSFDFNLIEPKIKNTTAFFLTLGGKKPIGKRWRITNTIGLDMQQLIILSGVKKDSISPSLISYSNAYYTELLPRLKTDIGINYQLFHFKNDCAISLGAGLGQMIALSAAGNTYSFAEYHLNFEGKKMTVFLSHSRTPYRMSIKNFESLWGDFQGQVGRTSYMFKIFETGLGLSYKL